MELKRSAHNLHPSSDIGVEMGCGGESHRGRCWRTVSDDKKDSDDHHESSLDPRNISKVILPPLGAASFKLQNQLSPMGTIILPTSSRYRCWETLMVVLVAYNAWVYPFEVAFLNSSPKRQLYIADNVVDTFFAIDIVLTFFVAYIDGRTHLLVRDPKKIAVRYLSTWFLMDMASTIPFEALAYFFTGKHRVALSYSVLGLLRFWRLRRLNQLFTRLEKDIRFSYFWVRCARLLFDDRLRCFWCTARGVFTTCWRIDTRTREGHGWEP